MSIKKVPFGCPVFTSQVEPETKSFLWVIKGVKELKRYNSWVVPNCQFEVGGFEWNLSLCPSTNEKFLYGLMTLVEPKTATAQYYVKFHVVNPQGHLILSSRFVCEHPAVAYGIGEKSTDKVKWEVLQFTENPINNFENLIFKDTLSILVEMTVFRDTKGNSNPK